MKKFIYNDYLEKFDSTFDCGPDEPDVCALSGCQDCFFRLNFTERIQEDVRQLRGDL